MAEIYPGAFDVPKHDRYRDDRAGLADTVDAVEAIHEDTAEPTGFPNTNTDTTLTWVDGTRTMQIASTGISFEYYIHGTKYQISGSKSHQIPDTEGMWHVYFDTDETLYSTQTFGEALLMDYCYIGNVYWDATNGEAVVVGDERHGMQPWQTHLNWHEKIGTYNRSGFGLADFVVDQNGNDDEDAEFSCASGILVDEDLTHNLATLAAPAGIPVIYKSGVGAYWRKDAAIGAPVKPGIAGMPAYNYDLTGSWTQGTIGNNKYVLAHILATNDPRAGHEFVCVQGEAEYLSKSAARAGANDEINELTTAGLPMQEFLWIGTVIYKGGGSNTYQAAVFSTDTGEDYVSWLGTELSPGTAPASHANLTHRDDPAQHPADAISVDATAFAGVLSATDVDAQTAMDTIDGHSHWAIRAYASKNSNYTLTTSDHFVQFAPALGSLLANLPTAASVSGIDYYVSRRSVSSAVIITPNGAETINGAATYSIGTDYQTVHFYSTGTEWLVLSLS